MLSILIPEYNYDCTKLVKDLANLCKKAGLVFEIIVMDDASEQFKTENRNISEIPGCFFVEKSPNAGMAKTRNRLAELARYRYLLMIDCDAEVRDETFIMNYLKVLGQAKVLSGGVGYSLKKPEASRCLRWYYGKKRESLPASVRNQNPYKSYLSFNILMEKSIAQKFPYDENFKDYGHEDSVMGNTLKQNGISILHIDNSLIHNGLDKNEVFLSKSLKAVEKYLTNPAFQSNELVEQIKIFRVFRWIKSIGLSGFLSFSFLLFKNVLKRNLCSAYPSLFVYDYYRLAYLCHLSKTSGT